MMMGWLVTSSEYVEAEEQYDATQIATQTGFVGAIDSEESWVAIFFWRAYDHYVVVQYTHQ